MAQHAAGPPHLETSFTRSWHFGWNGLRLSKMRDTRELARSHPVCSAMVIALPGQCLHSAEADVRTPRRKSGLDPSLVKTPTSKLARRKLYRLP